MNCTGEQHRMSRFVNPISGRSVVVPFDDSLIAGPIGGLDDLGGKLGEVGKAGANGILAFPGVFLNHGVQVQSLGWICNLTASTTRVSHTNKVQVMQLVDALAVGADAVAAHVNVSSRFEPQMLTTLGRVCSDGRRYGVPVVAIVYPRREAEDGSDYNYTSEREDDQATFSGLVAHCARIAKELGASVVKTQYTGSKMSFAAVVAAADPLPVWIAGGAMMPVKKVLETARDALDVGASGVSFGRNVYGRANSAAILSALSAVVHDGSSVAEALSICSDD